MKDSKPTRNLGGVTRRGLLTTGALLFLEGARAFESADDRRWFVTLTGQSNGKGRSPAVTAKALFPSDRAFGESLVPLAEHVRESVLTAALDGLASGLGAANPGLIGYEEAENHAAYAKLKLGSPCYTRILRQLARTKRTVAKDARRGLRSLAVLTIHGESDHVLGTKKYREILSDWQSSFDRDMRAVTGQSEPVMLLTDQMSSWTVYGSLTSEIPLEQLAASQGSNDIVLVGPKYQYSYLDGKHLMSAHYQWLGEQYGKVLARIFAEKKTWRPLSPKHVTISSDRKILRVVMHVPVAPLVFDTKRVPAAPAMGFELVHDRLFERVPEVERVSLASKDTVELVTSGPVPLGASLAYAMSGRPTAYAGSGGGRASGSAHGNLRDSDRTKSLHADWPLYNWCCHFKVPVPG